MSIDELPEQFEAFTERARAVLDREIKEARTTIDSLNAEKASAQAALAQLADEHKKAKAELDATLKHLNKGSGLAVLDAEIKTARQTLAKLQIDIAQAETAAAATKKQTTEAEALRVSTWNEVARLRNERSEHEARMANLRMKLQQVQLGSQP